MRIGVDIDDTLTNTKEAQIGCWKEYVTLYPNDNYTSELPSNINYFGDPYIDTFWDMYREVLSFKTKFKENASEVLNKLRSMGHEIIIITSRPKDKYDGLIDRINGLFNDNGLIVDSIITDIRNKGEYCFNNNIDILIDDDIRHITSANEYAIHTILFNNDAEYDGVQTTSWLWVERIIELLNLNESKQKLLK